MRDQPSSKRKRGPSKNSLRFKAFQAGLPYMVVYLRIRNGGWSEERALSTPKIERVSQLVKYGIKYKNGVLVDCHKPLGTNGENFQKPASI